MTILCLQSCDPFDTRKYRDEVKVHFEKLLNSFSAIKGKTKAPDGFYPNILKIEPNVSLNGKNYVLDHLYLSDRVNIVDISIALESTEIKSKDKKAQTRDDYYMVITYYKYKDQSDTVGEKRVVKEKLKYLKDEIFTEGKSVRLSNDSSRDGSYKIKNLVEISANRIDFIIRIEMEDTLGMKDIKSVARYKIQKPAGAL